MPRDNTLSLGLLGRPCRRISYGLAGHWAIRENNYRGIADVGIRPFATPLLTLFGDAAMRDDESLKDLRWSAGASFEPVPGIALQGKFYRGGAFAAGISISVTGGAVSFFPHFGEDGKQDYNTYGIRLGVPAPSVLARKTMKGKMFLRLDLDDRIKYQRYRLFDTEGHTLKELLEILETAKQDERISGLAIRITEDLQGSIEPVWEVREKIRELKDSGKTVVVFLERGGWLHYYLASVADKIMVDPETSVIIQGFNLGKTYYRNLLDKLGIGVEELRFFKYKSAFESLSRTDMSEADREQLHALAQGFYDQMRDDICRSRGIEPEQFDHIIDEVGLLNADSLTAYHLVDTTGRWDDVSDLIERIEGHKKRMISPLALKALQPYQREWGRAPQIAVIYALGPCAMNYGINARRLQRVIKRARECKRIKAVVLRADSPGGDILPSDIVAGELKKTAEKKPVIVSQGMVAASGGYWISMNGDKILASPWTITGSIGVIGGWFYNNGFGDKIGFSYDHTQVGKHADLGDGIRIPLIGVLPERNLDPEEHSFIERQIRLWYDKFLDKVAQGRGMAKDSVHAIAQGRVWTGSAGLENGLVDEIGGLEQAVEAAREAAGIKPRRRVEVVEMPEKGLINLSRLQPTMLGINWTARWRDAHRAELDYLRMIVEAEGRPMAILPPEYYIQW